MNIHVGDRRMEKPEFGSSPGFVITARPCRVVYIHPKQRFYTVEFCMPGGTFRQSYLIRDREGLSSENNRNHEQQGRRRKNRHGY